MSIDTTWETESTSSDVTEKLAEQIGRKLRGGEVIELTSDLGGGKTTFVRGLARGAGSEDKVASPSFTISKVYQAGSFEIHHFDFYRLGDPGLMAYELQELVGDKSIVVVVEWADVVRDVLPDDRMTISITKSGDESRKLMFCYPENLKYLLEASC